MKKRANEPASLLQMLLGCRVSEEQEADRDIMFSFDESVGLDELIENLNDSSNQGNPNRNPQDSSSNNVEAGKRAKRLVQEIITNPFMNRYRLDSNDVMVVLRIWKIMTKNISGSPEWDKMLEWTDLDTNNPTACIGYITSLLARKIIQIEGYSSVDYHSDPFVLMESSFKLHCLFKYDLLGISLKDRLEACLKPSWNTMEDIRHDLLIVHSILRKSIPELSADNEVISCDYEWLRSCLDPLMLHLSVAESKLPLCAMIRENELSERDQLIILWLMGDHYTRNQSRIDNILNLISSDYRERLENLNYFRDISKLPKLGILVFQDHCYRSCENTVVLSEQFIESLEQVCTGQNPERLAGKFLLEINSTQSFDDLILPEGNKKLLLSCLKRLQPGSSEELEDWGIIGSNEERGFSLLLHGYPGTGKTFTAGAIANLLGKRLISINAALLRDKYYGETEKQIKMLFREMRSLIENTDNQPVFLLNEADQLIHKRSLGGENSDMAENAIQNIFLEEMESFPGILIMTTNLPENIDPAYFRRFNIKLELQRPDYDCRVKLWKLHLNERIPGAMDIDIKYLAKLYDFTGGQIYMVVLNACNEAIARNGWHRRLCMDDLVKYADLEQGHCGERLMKKAVGFVM